MKWFEVVEDLGDGSNGVRRFRTAKEAEEYCDKNEEYCYSGFDEVDTESKYFFFDNED